MTDTKTPTDTVLQAFTNAFTTFNDSFDPDETQNVVHGLIMVARSIDRLADAVARLAPVE